MTPLYVAISCSPYSRGCSKGLPYSRLPTHICNIHDSCQEPAAGGHLGQAVAVLPCRDAMLVLGQSRLCSIQLCLRCLPLLAL